MRFVRNAILCTACAICFVLVPLTFGFDLEKYSRLDSPRQEQFCKAAAQANPGVVKQLQSIAERYVKQIQSDLAALAGRHSWLAAFTNSHPCLAGIGQSKIEVPGANEPEKVLCRLELEKNTHSVETVVGIHQEPNKDGCILRVWVNNIVPPCDWRGIVSARFFVNEMEMRANYQLSLSKKNSDLAKTVRALILKRFKEMCEEMKKLQTAEDKAAEESAFGFGIDLDEKWPR